jgi:hypothetical protein
MQPTTPIPTIARVVVVDAVTAALAALREVNEYAGGHYDATLAGEHLKWVEAMVVADQHDPLLHLRIGDASVVLEDAAATMPQRPRLLEVVVRLRAASLLLQQARRAADLEARLRDILGAAQDLGDAAGDLEGETPRTMTDDDGEAVAHIIELAQFIAIKARA